MNNIKNISPQENKFLQRASVIDKSPKSLWFFGEIDENWNDRPVVAIVGSRKPTDYGRGVTLRLASALAARGVIIISGLALGHDALAARGALEGGGTTVAVIGNGLNNIHPRSNHLLAEQIIESGGAIISEFEPDAPVYKQNFLLRNRIISALSDVIIVVEAGERSGTLNTAAHALNQGKELMAVPGNITSPLSAGCNRLVAQGATPVLSVDDVLERLRSLYSTGNNAAAKYLGETPAKKFTVSPAKLATTIKGNDDIETKILRAIAGGFTDGDEILRAAKISAEEYGVALMMLEINGQIRALGANRWALK